MHVHGTSRRLEGIDAGLVRRAARAPARIDRADSYPHEASHHGQQQYEALLRPSRRSPLFLSSSALRTNRGGCLARLPDIDSVHDRLGVIIGYLDLPEAMRQSVTMEYARARHHDGRSTSEVAPLTANKETTVCVCACTGCSSVSANMPQYLANMDKLEQAVAAVQRYQLAPGEKSVTALVGDRRCVDTGPASFASSTLPATAIPLHPHPRALCPIPPHPRDILSARSIALD